MVTTCRRRHAAAAVLASGLSLYQVKVHGAADFKEISHRIFIFITMIVSSSVCRQVLLQRWVKYSIVQVQVQVQVLMPYSTSLSIGTQT